MSSFIVTGASRGIGLELVNQLATEGKSKVSKIFALSRGKASDELSKLVSANTGRVIYISAEVTDQSSIDAAVKDVESELNGKGLDVLVNNVGVSKLWQLIHCMAT